MIRSTTVGAALAATLALPVSAATYTYFDFHDPSNLTLNGDAKILGNDRLRLTDAVDNLAGSVFTRFGVEADGFHTAFAFRINKSGGTKADCRGQTGGEGLAFVLQGTSPTALGEDGNGLGFEGIPQSFAIAFDASCDESAGESAANAITLVANDTRLASVRINRGFDNKHVKYVWVDYDGGELQVRISQAETRPDEPVLAYFGDIPAMVGGSICCAGFTASTGDGKKSANLIYSWRYQEAPPNGTPAFSPTRPNLVTPVCRTKVGTSLRKR